MIPVDNAEDYYSERHRMELAMAEAATDPAVRTIHLEMARRYAKRAGEDAAVPVSDLGPPADPST
jgi:hypothetical protein